MPFGWALFLGEDGCDNPGAVSGMLFGGRQSGQEQGFRMAGIALDSQAGEAGGV